MTLSDQDVEVIEKALLVADISFSALILNLKGEQCGEGMAVARLEIKKALEVIESNERRS